ncbi:MAG: class I SAM-dependent RNA methyltransferase [Acidimicrobiia bacterium]
MSLKALVVCPPGLEPLLAAEIRALGGDPGSPIHGGVPVEVSQAQLYAYNLRLRVATRVLLRLGNGFVDGPQSLHRLLDSMDWTRYCSGCSVVVTATSHSSTLFHTGLVEEAAMELIAKRAAVVPQGPDVPEQRVVIRIDHDRAVVSIDSSGDRLDRRGYRLFGAKAPLRETLAAALVLSSGWDPRTPLVDPFCGSGTIAIEAAMAAQGLAPGRNRRFAFQDWPSFTRSAWKQAKAGAAAAERPSMTPVIVAGDRDGGAIEATLANAERAGVAVDARHGSFSSLEMPSGRGAIVTNPPYGVRVGDQRSLRDLYDSFGRWLPERAPGWTITLLDADRTLTSRLGLPLTERIRTANGGIDVSVMHGVVRDPSQAAGAPPAKPAHRASVISVPRSGDRDPRPGQL